MTNIDMEDLPPDEIEMALELSENQVKDFVTHPVWKAIVRTIKERIDICNNNLGTLNDILEIKKEQGEVLALRALLIQPSLLIQDIREAQQEALDKKDKDDART